MTKKPSARHIHGLKQQDHSSESKLSSKECLNMFAKITSLMFCIFAVIVYFCWNNLYTHSRNSLQKSTLHPALVEDLYNQTNWSTYRPQLYFGLKTKHPESPLFGIIWYQQPNEAFSQQFSPRHWCEHGDDVKFSWVAHDGRTFGRELIDDNDLGMQVDWIANGKKSWNVHLSANSSHTYALVFYLAVQDKNSEFMKLDRKQYKSNGLNYAFIDGYSHILGQFALNMCISGNFSPDGFSSIAYKIPPFMDIRHVNQLLKVSLGRNDGRIELNLVQNDEIPGFDDGVANFAAMQIIFSKNMLVELEFLAENDEKIEDFENIFTQKLEDFAKKFDETFPIDSQDDLGSLRQLGTVALSNLLGGIGVWHGHSLVKTINNPDKVFPYGPLSLISAVPSRPFFPRGFLWDEGFHNLIIRHFDPQQTLQILASWLDSMNIDGWMPREMILGSEAQAKVPSEFLVQDPSVANPPMFFYVLEKFLLDSAMFNRHSARLVLLYPRIKHFYLWLRETQKGPKIGTMQWQGRNRTTQMELNPKVLPSGLDDFPRATHPSIEEYHLDLRCWMALSSKVLRQLAETFGDSAWVPVIEEDVRLFNDFNALDALHWSESAQQYADFGLHSGNVQLVQVTHAEPKNAYGKVQKMNQEKIFKRKTFEEPRPRLVDDVFGYVNLFPLLLRLLPPDSAKLGIMLRSLNRTEHLWTPFGLRSLSTKSPYYLARNTEHDPPYWRGPIWINMNFLALDSLRHYAMADGPFSKLSSELFKQLRLNVIRNIAAQYKSTGFLWENYNDRTGEGMGTRPFTGWTALVVNILAEKFN